MNQTFKNLTPEEQFLWQCALHWRQPERLSDANGLDWQKVVETGKWNRMQTLLLGILESTNQLDKLPAGARALLEEDAERLRSNAAMMGESLHQYLQLASERQLDTAVLKGLSLSVNIYGNAAMRPGGDIDLLVRRRDVDASIAILDEMGIGQWWPNLLADPYYDRHHLHQQRCTPDLKIWFEIHWALDHPYTLLTVNYDAMMDRCTPDTLMDAPVCAFSPSDLLLTVAIHLVKHAVYLPAVYLQPNLPQIILADGMLMYYLDAAEVVKVHSEDIDWQLAVAVAQESGAVDILGSVLHVCRHYLNAPVPDWVLSALPVTGQGNLVNRTQQRVADYELQRYLGEEQSRLWNFLLDTNGAFILRPIRVLDTVSYFFPDADYRQRRYGDDSLGAGVRHFFKATGQYVRLSVDTVYYTWERYRRLKKLNQSASLFNRLETEG